MPDFIGQRLQGVIVLQQLERVTNGAANRIALFFHGGRPAQHVEQGRLQVQRMMAIGRAFLEVIVEVPAPVRRPLAKLLHESPIARQLRVDVVQLDREVENDVWSKVQVLLGPPMKSVPYQVL